MDSSKHVDEASDLAPRKASSKSFPVRGAKAAGGKRQHDEAAFAVKIQSIHRGNSARKQIKAMTGFETPRRGSAGLGGVSVIIDKLEIKRLAAAEKRVEAAMRSELADLTTDLENHLEFNFLDPNHHPLHGLQDWSEQTWAAHLQEQPGLAAMLAQSLLSDAEKGAKVEPSEGALLGQLEQKPAILARHVKKQLKHALPLHKWRTILAFQNAAMNRLHDLDEHASAFYIAAPVLSTALFRRDFPLGVDKRVQNARYKFAIENSGLFEVRHRESKRVSFAIYLLLLGFGVFLIIYFLNYTVGQPDNWTMAATIQDLESPDYTAVVNKRTKDRGRVASIMQSLTFSAIVNATLDKIGKIDPATSTVLIGMFLGNTFGFVLDTMLASDEGLREYLWSPPAGMRYALGSLATDRFGRFFVTVLFDMFFTVILFKHFYSKLVRVAGFSYNGREWMANFVVSGFIGVITFVVYANMTRFSWAYPSGVEDVAEQWISGPTMLLACVIMNMVYLNSETRVRIEEPGINDPSTKLVVTMLTFTILYLLQENDILDPSEPPREQNVTADWTDVSLPLKGVCESKSRSTIGFLIFSGITIISLGGVIFGTSQQTLKGVWREVCPAPKVAEEPQHTARKDSGGNDVPPSPGSPALPSVGLRRQATTVLPIPRAPTSRKERMQGMCCLFFSYLLAIFILMLFFSVTPLASHDGGGVPRNDSYWRDACDNNDIEFLDRLGLS